MVEQKNTNGEKPIEQEKQTESSQTNQALIIPDMEEDRPPSEAIKRAINVITRTAVVEAQIGEEEKPQTDLIRTPWILQQFFNGEIDLDVELAQRFPQMPVMSHIKFRELGDKTRRGVATISVPDGSAQAFMDVDSESQVMQFSFTFGSMLTLRFMLQSLSEMDRLRWLELMQREQGGLAFLWGPKRWEQDYMICVSRRYFTNLYAFSPNNFEAGIRITPDVTKKLLVWVGNFWKKDEEKEDSPPTLLTW